MNKTIRVSNVETKEGQYGPSMKVGYKPPNGEWENYFVNKPELFGYFSKGETVAIEYKTTEKGYHVIEGVSPVAQPAHGSTEAAKNDSIEHQTIIKAWAQVKAGTDVSAEAFSADVRAIHDAVFGAPLKEMKKKAAEALGAADDEEFPF